MTQGTDNFTLHHGDCLEVMPGIASGSVDAVLCDLPYGTTDCDWDSQLPLGQLWEQYRRLLKKNGAVILTASQPFTSALVMSNPDWFKCEWIWEKTQGSNFATVKYMPMKEHESVLVFCAGRVTYHEQRIPRSDAGKARKKYRHVAGTGRREAYSGIKTGIEVNTDHETRCPRSIVKFANERGLHPSQKPVGLMEYFIRTYTNPGDTVLDNCAGSFTTGVACLNTERKFVGIEKDSEYYRIGVERIAAARQQASLFTVA